MNNSKGSVGICTIGGEVLHGSTLNTNASWLGTALRLSGWKVERQWTVPDDADAFASLWPACSAGLDLVVVTGGLGPTADDRTRSILAQTCGTTLERNPAAQAQVESWCARRGRECGSRDLRQADIPRGASILSNPVGSAPGFLLRSEAPMVASLPGVPTEMRVMFTQSLLPLLGTGGSNASKEILIRMGEPELDELLDSLQIPEGCSWASLPQEDGVLLRAYGHMADHSAEERVARLHSDMLRLLAPVQDRIVSTDGSGLAQTLLLELGSADFTLSVCESCTGGWIGQVLTAVPGSSAVFLGGAITYAGRLKTLFAGVDTVTLSSHGEVSEATVTQMAEGIRKATGSSIGIATSGIAGPGGGSEAKPIGTVWMGISAPWGTRAFCQKFPGNRDMVRRRSVYTLLGTLLSDFRAAHKNTCTPVQH